MTEKHSHPDDTALEMLFEAAREVAPAPSPDFMSRLAADAVSAAPEFSWVTPKTHKAQSFVARASRWMTATGLAGSAALGVWIGMASPELIDEILYLDATNDEIALSDFLPSADLSEFAKIGAGG